MMTSTTLMQPSVLKEWPAGLQIHDSRTHTLFCSRDPSDARADAPPQTHPVEVLISLVSVMLGCTAVELPRGDTKHVTSSQIKSISLADDRWLSIISLITSLVNTLLVDCSLFHASEDTGVSAHSQCRPAEGGMKPVCAALTLGPRASESFCVMKQVQPRWSHTVQSGINPVTSNW